jgi:hypothetical protein
VSFSATSSSKPPWNVLVELVITRFGLGEALGELD